jgi:hypothetical protein
MKKDFIWLRKVILNNDNKLIHYDSLVRLIELFTIKWKDRKDNLIFAEAYSSYKVYLKLTLRHTHLIKPI